MATDVATSSSRSASDGPSTPGGGAGSEPDTDPELPGPHAPAASGDRHPVPQPSSEPAPQPSSEPVLPPRPLPSADRMESLVLRGLESSRVPEPPGPVGLLVPPALALVSIGLGWVVIGPLTDPARMLWATAVLLVLIVLRVPMERTLARRGAGRPPVTALYAVHLILLVTAIVLNPLACIYAFTGYLDAFRYTSGRLTWTLVLISALLMAIGQTGGVGQVLEMPLLFLGLATVNIFLALLMIYVTVVRDRELEERERTLRALQQATRERDALEGELLRRAHETGISDERARLSREIHDTVAQGLVGVIRQLETVGEELGGPAPGQADQPAPRQADGSTHGQEARRRVAIAEEAARDCLDEARRAVEALAPRQLAEAGTAEGLGELVARWARTHRIVATFDADEAPCQGTHAAVLVRIAQEGLANVARHSGASTVTVTLSGSEDEQSLQLRDDGHGFDPDTVARGHGLANMTQRVEEVGGHLYVSSREGAGTTVIATVPR